MAAPIGGGFNLPIQDSSVVTDNDDKVCVVSIVGKGSSRSYQQNKASLLNRIIGRDAFQNRILPQENDSSRNSYVKIEGYYDRNTNVIYLHLESLHDVKKLAALCMGGPHPAEEETQNCFSLLQTAEYDHSRAMLLLFSISHIISVIHPGSSLDVSYVKYFRILDLVRQKMQPCISELLKGLDVPLSKDWLSAGRPCSPRVLFVFETCLLDSTSLEPESTVLNKTRSQKVPLIKKLQHNIEDQIYRILRKSRIITNISNNSLFAVPANQEFVYVFSKQEDTQDLASFYLTQLRNNCTQTEQSRSKSYSSNRRGAQLHSASSQGSEAAQKASVKAAPADINTFKAFLWQHVEIAFSKGFNDNVGRNPVPPVFELPTAKTWKAVCNAVYGLLMDNANDAQAKPHFNTLKSLLEIDSRFSENRCGKVLPLAQSAYQEGLPKHYTKGFHLNKLSQARRVFLQHARGPACDKYLGQLEEECSKIWKNGRQLCEVISLTGKHCINPLHRLPESAETEENRNLPEMIHSSSVKTKAACNCGMKQAERDDPFDHKAANCDFYQKLDGICCHKLDHYEIPVFHASILDVKAGVVEQREPGVPLTRKDSSKLDIIQAMSSLSLALSLGQSAGSQVYPHSPHSSYNPDSAVPVAIASPANLDQQQVVTSQEEEEGGRQAARQHSTTEYLPGMLHTDSPAGLLPKFSSWSLVCVGKYCNYTHTQGLDQPGFLHGSNYLLPWDMNVRGDREKWPTIGETSGKKGKQKKTIKEVPEVHVKMFFGIEYECPRGHRFFCSSPDKVIKVTGVQNVKDNAQKILTMPMPLYFPCACRSSKGYMAQLMRAYVVMPDCPVEVQLNPRVQPGAPPCPVFYACSDGPLNILSGGIWVLRLPYIYMGEQGAFMMPSDIQPCKLLKGLFNIVEKNPS